jgi:hypothetical protein
VIAPVVEEELDDDVEIRMNRSDYGVEIQIDQADDAVENGIDEAGHTVDCCWKRLK